MPIDADLDRLDGLIRTKVIDPLAFAHIRSHLKTLRDTRSFRYPELVDARDVTSLRGSMDELKAVARAAKNTLGHAHVADRAVVVDTDRAFRSARVVSALVAGWMRLGVFEEEDDAENWLAERREWALPPRAEWRPGS
jgi:hypothetical protein